MGKGRSRPSSAGLWAKSGMSLVCKGSGWKILRNLDFIYELKHNFDVLLAGFNYRALQAKVICWWAGRENYLPKRKSLEDFLGQDRVTSEVIDCDHDHIVHHSDFVRSLMTHFSAGG